MPMKEFSESAGIALFGDPGFSPVPGCPAGAVPTEILDHKGIHAIYGTAGRKKTLRAKYARVRASCSNIYIDIESIPNFLFCCPKGF